MDDDKLMILFVCNANMCRSQIAEGWANHLKGDIMCAFSAGVTPGYKVSGAAVQTMRDAGVDISNHYAKSVDEWTGVAFDYVVTLSPQAKEHCPKFAPCAKILHRPIADHLPKLDAMGKNHQGLIDTSNEIRALIETMPQSLLNTESEE